MPIGFVVTDIIEGIIENLAADSITSFMKAILSGEFQSIINDMQPDCDVSEPIMAFIDALESYGIDTSEFGNEEWESIAAVISDLMS